jgi:hypothetical protein
MYHTITQLAFWKKFTKFTIIGSSLLMLAYVGMYSVSAQDGPDTADARHRTTYRSSSDTRAVAIANSYSSSGGSYLQGDRYYQPVQYPIYPSRVVYNDPVTYNYDYDYNYYRPAQVARPAPTYYSDCRHHCYIDDGNYGSAYPTYTTNDYWAGWDPNRYPGGGYTTSNDYWAGWDPNRYPGGI